MARPAETHGKRKNPAEKVVMSTEKASSELKEIHRRIMQVYEIAGMAEIDRNEMLDRLFTQKRTLLSVIRENEDKNY